MGKRRSSLKAETHTPLYSPSFLQSWCLSFPRPVSNVQVSIFFVSLSLVFSPPPSISSVSLVNKAVVDFFFVELGVERHFEALRHFLLMEDGEFAQSLSDLLFEKVTLSQMCHCCVFRIGWHVVFLFSLQFYRRGREMSNVLVSSWIHILSLSDQHCVFLMLSSYSLWNTPEDAHTTKTNSSQKEVTTSHFLDPRAHEYCDYTGITSSKKAVLGAALISIFILRMTNNDGEVSLTKPQLSPRTLQFSSARRHISVNCIPSQGFRFATCNFTVLVQSLCWCSCFFPAAAVSWREALKTSDMSQGRQTALSTS